MRGPGDSAGTAWRALTSSSSRDVMNVGRYEVTPVSSSASPATAVVARVGGEKVDAAEPVHLEVDEPGAAIPRPRPPFREDRRH